MPVVEKRRMFFRLFDGEACLEPGVFGTSHPHAGQPVVDPDFIVAPLAAFDRARRPHRLRRRPLRQGDRRPRRARRSRSASPASPSPARRWSACRSSRTTCRSPLIATERELIARGARRVRLLFLGDVVGRSGRAAIAAQLPGLIARHRFDFVVVNGENAAGGFGITEEILQELLDAGADCVTTGNHVWDQREALIFADRARPLPAPGQLSARHARPRRQRLSPRRTARACSSSTSWARSSCRRSTIRSRR